MKKIFSVVAAVATLLCTSADAQPAPGSGGGRGMHGKGGCPLAADPEQCLARHQAHQQVMAACRDQRGPERRQCVHAQAQKVDCSQARSPQQCELRKQAYAACQDQAGPAFRQCVDSKMPAIDCSKAVDPARCEQHQNARTACRDKSGPEYRQCLRDILAPAK